MTNPTPEHTRPGRALDLAGRALALTTIANHDANEGAARIYQALLAAEQRGAHAAAQAIADTPNPGLTGPELDAWNAATARAINIATNLYHHARGTR